MPLIPSPIAVLGALIGWIVGRYLLLRWRLYRAGHAVPWTLVRLPGAPGWQVVNVENRKCPPLVFWQRADALVVLEALNKRARAFALETQ